MIENCVSLFLTVRGHAAAKKRARLISKQEKKSFKGVLKKNIIFFFQAKNFIFTTKYFLFIAWASFRNDKKDRTEIVCCGLKNKTKTSKTDHPFEPSDAPGTTNTAKTTSNSTALPPPPYPKKKKKKKKTYQIIRTLNYSGLHISVEMNSKFALEHINNGFEVICEIAGL